MSEDGQPDEAKEWEDLEGRGFAYEEGIDWRMNRNESKY